MKEISIVVKCSALIMFGMLLAGFGGRVVRQNRTLTSFEVMSLALWQSAINEGVADQDAEVKTRTVGEFVIVRITPSGDTLKRSHEVLWVRDIAVSPGIYADGLLKDEILRKPLKATAKFRAEIEAYRQSLLKVTRVSNKF